MTNSQHSYLFATHINVRSWGVNVLICLYKIPLGDTVQLQAFIAAIESFCINNLNRYNSIYPYGITHI